MVCACKGDLFIEMKYFEFGKENKELISDTEEEEHELNDIYKTLTPQQQCEMKHENWKRVFDVTPFENESL